MRSTLTELHTKFSGPHGETSCEVDIVLVCKKLEGIAFTQPAITSLPEFRVNLAPPFSRVGVDFTGPMCQVSK